MQSEVESQNGLDNDPGEESFEEYDIEDLSSHDSDKNEKEEFQISTTSPKIPTMAQQRRYQSRRTNKYKRYASRIEVENIDISFFPMRDETLTVEEVSRVAKQLGYLPYNLIRVGAYDFESAVRPVVAILYPLNAMKIGGRFDVSEGLKPFPTIYWMTCPIMQARISELEKSGWIRVFDNQLSANNFNNDYARMMQNSHRLYGQARWEMLREEDKEYVDRQGW